MEDYRVTQTGDEIQEIFNQSPVDTADIAELKEATTSLDGRLEAVEGKIPSGASSENPLTDKQYVDSSIASASATFRGTYNEVTDLELTTEATHAEIGEALASVIDTADSNDYCFVQIPTADATPTEIESIERYKFVTGTGWQYEYTLNNSGFTADQWAAINSGITSGLVAKLTDLPTNAELNTLLNGKANAADVYTKSETYTKTELDTQLGAKANSADVYPKTDTYTKQEVDALITTPEVQYVTVTATAGTTAVTDVLPATGAANTIYRVGSWDGTQYATGVYSEYAWNGTTYILLDVKNYGFATGSDFDNPTTAQRELVTTVGAVLDGISEGVFDLTAKTGDSYATLADALTAANTSIPTNKKKGGMSIKFVQSSDNKYVQYRYMGTAVTGNPNPFLNEANWQGVDGTPTVGSHNFVESSGVFDSVVSYKSVKSIEKSSLTINSSGKILSVGASYFVKYYVATSNCDISLYVTNNNSYENNGRVFVSSSEANITANNYVTLLEQVAYQGSKNIKYHLTTGQCLGVTCRADDSVAFKIAISHTSEIADLSDVQSLLRIPKEGVNLIQLTEIQQNVLVNSYGVFQYNSQGWRGIEIEFCATDVPIYINKIYKGYYALLDANGDVVKVVQNSNTDLYNGYKLPSNVKKGRFSISNTISDNDISTYAYISYGRPLMQDEINSRVGLMGSFTYKKIERPTDYNGGDITAFEKILCIGDSITNGSFNYTPISGETFTARKALSYPANLASITGRTVINLGDAGDSSSTWWTAHQNDEELSGVDCAIIELGINDNPSTLDTTSKDAFDNIISALKTRNPKIKIFLSSIPTGKSYKAQTAEDSYYTLDQWLRTYYETYYANDNQVFFLDVARYGHLLEKYSNDSKYDDYNEGHLSAYGYWRLAMDYRNYISYIMKNSEIYFKDIQFIGTPFNYK